MKKINYSNVENHIVQWLGDYLKTSNQKGFVIGVSGGVDSAVVSTLCAKTGYPVLCISMPINQASEQLKRANNHIKWLKEKYTNVKDITIDLTFSYSSQVASIGDALYSNGFSHDQFEKSKCDLCDANLRSRHRMETLYYFAGLFGYLVAGTGNKVEDFGVGFFTKYGDGGVDISPIGDLMKSEVRGLGEYMGVLEEIVNAKPTDGLWDNGATDEDQIGATYDELEWAMEYFEDNINDIRLGVHSTNKLTERQKQVFEIYKTRHIANAHKMDMPPICTITNDIKEK